MPEDCRGARGRRRLRGAQPSDSVAQPRPQELAANSRVVIDYIDPRVPRSQATLDRLRKRQVLEELSHVPVAAAAAARVAGPHQELRHGERLLRAGGMGDQPLLRVLRDIWRAIAPQGAVAAGLYPRRGDRRRLHRRHLPRAGPRAVRHPEHSGVRARGGRRRPVVGLPHAAVRQGRGAHDHPGRGVHLSGLRKSAHPHRVCRRARRAGAAVLQLPLPRLWRRAGGVPGICRPRRAAEGARRAGVRASICWSAARSPRPSCRTSTWK